MWCAERTFLLISAASMSIWTIFAVLQNLFTSPVTRSLNLLPRERNSSHSETATLVARVPCMPIMPVKFGWDEGMQPVPISVVPTGDLINSARCTTSSLAPKSSAPPPQSRNTFSLVLISSASDWIPASASASSCGTFLYVSMVSFVYSVDSAVTFFGISTSTGPGLPERAMSNASRRICARSLTSFTMKLCFVIGVVMPVISASWKLSFPMRLTLTLPVMNTTGTLSR